jgi:hypothetical protein
MSQKALTPQAVSRYLKSKGVTVTPAAADLTLGGVRVARAGYRDAVVVTVTLACGLARQEAALAAAVADVLRAGGYDIDVNELNASIFYVSREA